MTQPDRRPSFSFRIENGASAAEHTVAADVLVQILQSAQQTFELIGMHVEGLSIRQRARVPSRTRQRFQLVCRLPKAGSYEMPVAVGSSQEMFELEYADKSMGVFQALMQRVSQRSLDGWAAILPDERIRRRVLEAVKGMAPSAGAKWSVSLQDPLQVEFARLDQGTVRFLQDSLVPKEQREASRVVTGELKSIDFVSRTLTIIYPPTNKALECIYDDEVEELLIERRRDLIQVTGRVLLDDEGQPKQLIDVSDIRDLDLSAFELTRVEAAEIILAAKTALVLEVFSDSTKQLIFVESDRLNILAYGTTREALLDELHAQIMMLWQEYALADDGLLDAQAMAVKYALLEQFEEVVDAAQAG